MHPKARPFAFWIRGYQNFYEDIVRAWCQDNGFETIGPRSVVGPDLTPSADAIESGQHGFLMIDLNQVRDEIANAYFATVPTATQ